MTGIKWPSSTTLRLQGSCQEYARQLPEGTWKLPGPHVIHTLPCRHKEQHGRHVPLATTLPWLPR